MTVAEIGQIIQRLRKKAKLTQFELAERVGISGRHLQRIESGQTGVNIEVVESLAAALGVPVATFFPKPFSPLALEALDATVDFLSKFQSLPEDAQTLIVALLENDPVLLDHVSPEFLDKWRQLIEHASKARRP